MNSKILNLFFLKRFFVILLFFPLILTAQTEEVTWNYPVHPGTDEWKQLDSFSERLDAFNIPDSILTEITTENLVKTCLKYPWWILITSRDNNQAGYDYLKSVFNGFRELEKRKDAGKELLRVYEKMLPEDINKFTTLVEQGVFSFQFTYIEILLAQTNILKNLDEKNFMHLLEKASSIYKEKSKAFDKFSYYGIANSCLILSRILELKSYYEFNILANNFPELMNFNKKGNSTNKILLDRIYLESANLFLK